MAIVVSLSTSAHLGAGGDVGRDGRVRRGDHAGALAPLIALMVALQAASASIVYSRVVDADTFFEYDFTLPANAFAPVHVVIVPLQD